MFRPPRVHLQEDGYTTGMVYCVVYGEITIKGICKIYKYKLFELSK